MIDVPFVGREAEVGILRTCLADARRGRGRVVLLGGEPGGGRSRLVEAAVAEAHGLGFAVAVGAFDPGGGMPEYWPWRQVHRGLAAPADAPRLTPDTGSPEERRFGLFDATARGLARRARPGPVLLVLEARVTFEERLARLPDYGMTQSCVERHCSGPIRGALSLPVAESGAMRSE